MSVCFSGSLLAYSCIQLLLSLFVLCCAVEKKYEVDGDDTRHARNNSFVRQSTSIFRRLNDAMTTKKYNTIAYVSK